MSRFVLAVPYNDRMVRAAKWHNNTDKDGAKRRRKEFRRKLIFASPYGLLALLVLLVILLGTPNPLSFVAFVLNAALMGARVIEAKKVGYGSWYQGDVERGIKKGLILELPEEVVARFHGTFGTLADIQDELEPYFDRILSLLEIAKNLSDELTDEGMKARIRSRIARTMDGIAEDKIQVLKSEREIHNEGIGKLLELDDDS